ncbi:MAG: methyltransferase family protein [Prochlorothrix sp.]
MPTSINRGALSKDWGFSAQWWRGQRGEYWAIGQGLISLGFLLLPSHALPVPAALQAAPDSWVAPLLVVRVGLAAVFGLLALVLLLGGVQSLGENLTPLPHPRDDGSLVTTGIYGWVRHPIYSGVILLSLAYACFLWSWPHFLGIIGIFLFYDFKSRQEEVWLSQKFADYGAYCQQVKKLIPGLY